MITELLERLRAVAPSVAITTIWEEEDDPDTSIFNVGWALELEDPCNWVCWESEVRAEAVVAGRLVSGSDYLCGTWERFGDNPAVTNPYISGYFPQKAEEALRQLRQQVGDHEGDQCRRLCVELTDAIAVVREHMREEYEKQKNGQEA